MYTCENCHVVTNLPRMLNGKIICNMCHKYETGSKGNTFLRDPEFITELPEGQSL